MSSISHLTRLFEVRPCAEPCRWNAPASAEISPGGVCPTHELRIGSYANQGIQQMDSFLLRCLIVRPSTLGSGVIWVERRGWGWYNGGEETLLPGRGSRGRKRASEKTEVRGDG